MAYHYFTLWLTILFGLSSFAKAMETMTFSTIEETLNASICSRVLREAYSEMGIRIDIQEHPGRRALQYANQGMTDGELFRIKGIDERYQNLIRVDVPINSLDGVAITNGLDFPVSGWESLNPYSVGIKRGIRFTEVGMAGFSGPPPYIVDSNDQLFKLLTAKRVDLVVLARVNGLYQMQKKRKPSIKILEPPIESYALYHYLHKKHESYIPQLTSILKKMKSDGRIDKIRQRFLAQILHDDMSMSHPVVYSPRCSNPAITTHDFYGNIDKATSSSLLPENCMGEAYANTNKEK